MKKIIIALVVVSALGASAFAGEIKREGGVMLGYGMPSGDVGDLVDGGIAFGLSYEGYKINDMFSVGGEFMYTGGSGSVGTIDYSVSTWGLSPYIKASKEVDISGKKADLYGLLGLGFYSVGTEIDAPGSILDSDDSETEIGFNLGGGLMFPIGDKMKLGGDLRYHIVASDVSYFVPSVKFIYSF